MLLVAIASSGHARFLFHSPINREVLQITSGSTESEEQISFKIGLKLYFMKSSIKIRPIHAYTSCNTSVPCVSRQCFLHFLSRYTARNTPSPIYSLKGRSRGAGPRVVSPTSVQWLRPVAIGGRSRASSRPLSINSGKI